jgi:hypothetical protein
MLTLKYKFNGNTFIKNIINIYLANVLEAAFDRENKTKPLSTGKGLGRGIC